MFGAAMATATMTADTSLKYSAEMFSRSASEKAEIVRGKYVRIGHGRRIGTVEYGENLEAEPGTVGHSTQTGTK